MERVKEELRYVKKVKQEIINDYLWQDSYKGVKKMEEKILNILEEVNEDILTYDGNNMIAEGIIDSLEIVEVITYLEEEFNIEINAENVIAANFANKDSIIEMVREIMGCN